MVSRSPCRWRPAPAPSPTDTPSGRRRVGRRQRAAPRPRSRPDQGQQELQPAVHPGRGRATSSTSPCSAAPRPRPAKLGVTRQHPGPAEVRPHPAEADPRLGDGRQAGRDADRADRRHRHADARCSRPPQSTKVVLVDTTTDDPSYATSAIASDNEGGGKAAFDAIKQLNPNGGKVMVMSVDPGISTTDARVKGFEDAVKADPKFTYLGRAVLAQRPGHRGQPDGLGPAEGPRHRRCLRRQPLQRRGHGHRRAPGQARATR